MAKAHWKSEMLRNNNCHIEDDVLDAMWKTTPEHVKAHYTADMAAALEILKNPLEEAHNAVYKYVSKDELGLILQAAINQTLKDDERNTQRWSDKDNADFDFPTSETQKPKNPSKTHTYTVK